MNFDPSTLSALGNLSSTISNIKIEPPYIPEYKDTVNGKMDRLQEGLNDSTNTNKDQLKELEKIRYENIKLNSQIDTLNKITDSQNETIASLQQSLIGIQSNVDALKTQFKSANKHSFVKGVAIGFIPSLVIFILTIIATQYGFL